MNCLHSVTCNGRNPPGLVLSQLPLKQTTLDNVKMRRRTLVLFKSVCFSSKRNHSLCFYCYCLFDTNQLSAIFGHRKVLFLAPFISLTLTQEHRLYSYPNITSPVFVNNPVGSSGQIKFPIITATYAQYLHNIKRRTFCAHIC